MTTAARSTMLAGDLIKRTALAKTKAEANQHMLTKKSHLAKNNDVPARISTIPSMNTTIPRYFDI